jgi:hypothetical protein
MCPRRARGGAATCDLRRHKHGRAHRLAAREARVLGGAPDPVNELASLRRSLLQQVALLQVAVRAAVRVQRIPRTVLDI